MMDCVKNLTTYMVMSITSCSKESGLEIGKIQAVTKQKNVAPSFSIDNILPLQTNSPISNCYSSPCVDKQRPTIIYPDQNLKMGMTVR
jgi:hypothetical protein